jgi:hypothetical protein
LENILTKFWDFITGRSQTQCLKSHIELLDSIIQNEQERFKVLVNYVNRLATAIAGTETTLFIGDPSDIDIALEDLISSASEQNQQLLNTRIKLAKAEACILELENIVAEIPTNGALE